MQLSIIKKTQPTSDLILLEMIAQTPFSIYAWEYDIMEIFG